jgi:hypothetical protein
MCREVFPRHKLGQDGFSVHRMSESFDGPGELLDEFAQVGICDLEQTAGWIPGKARTP